MKDDPIINSGEYDWLSPDISKNIRRWYIPIFPVGLINISLDGIVWRYSFCLEVFIIWICYVVHNETGDRLDYEVPTSISIESLTT